MTKKFLICIMLLLLITPPPACDEDIMTNIDLYDIDVRIFDERLDKYVIDMFLARIPEYPYICTMADFELRESYANFVVTNVDAINEHRMNVRFRLTANEREGDPDVDIFMIFHESRHDSHDAMRKFALTSAAPIPRIFASQLGIGDFAIYDQGLARFIRGNVDVIIIVSGTGSIDIIPLAEEIDQQILEIITGAGADKE